MNKVVIVIDRLLDVVSKEMTIGGIQSYIISLSHLISDSYEDAEIYIIQRSIDEFLVDLDWALVIGIGSMRLNNLKKYIESSFSDKDTLLIFGSDQYSFKTSFTAINIQHGIAFDVEAFDSGLRRYFDCSKITRIIYKWAQRYNAIRLSSRGKITVCVDYNFYNFARTYGSWLTGRLRVIPNFVEQSLSTTPVFTRGSFIVARRFVKRRGIEEVLNVFEFLLDGGQDITVTFAGSGPLQGRIAALANRYPENVFMTSYTSEQAVEIHKNYEFAIIPSIGSEGTSLSLLEAMEAGCVCLATSVGGLTNIVIDGHNGVLSEPTISSLLKTVQRVLNMDDDSKRKMVQAAKSTVRDSFSKDKWDSSWKKVLNEYFYF